MSVPTRLPSRGSSASTAGSSVMPSDGPAAAKARRLPTTSSRTSSSACGSRWSVSKQSTTLPSYVYKAAIRETVRAVRRERARSGIAAAHEFEPTRLPADPEQLVVSRERREALRAALASLAPDRARAVRAHLGGWSVQELMEMTGWPYQRARNLIARGMADLRAALIARGVR